MRGEYSAALVVAEHFSAEANLQRQLGQYTDRQAVAKLRSGRATPEALRPVI